MDNDLSFGRWVKVRRVALRLTQGKLAERTGYSTVTIRKIESDDLRPSRQIAEKLAEVLALTSEERTDFVLLARADVGTEQGRQAPPKTKHPPSIPPHEAAIPPFLAEEALVATPPPLFVGRARELAELEATLETAASGKGQILFVIGDAGRGKTTLVQEFARRALHENALLLVIGGHCSAYTGIGDPYLPFRELLSTLAGDVEAKWSSGLLSAQSARTLWEAMPITTPVLVEHAPDLIGRFVLAETLQRHAAHLAQPNAAWVQRLAKLTADDQRLPLEEKHVFAQVTAVLKAMAAQRPLLLILEDLHWIDTASSSLLFHLSREISNCPILILGTYRPDELVGKREERHPLLNITKELKRQHGDIWLDLGNLSAVEGRDFVDAYLDTQPNRLSGAFRSAFFHHTGGHALFVVELLREMHTRGELYKDAEGYWIEGTTLDWHTLPAKVEGVIEKRIERLDEAHQVMLSVASVEGEIFTAEVVARVQQWQERELVQRLSNELDRQHRLVTALALNQVGRQRLSSYRFRHYLFQHYLYHRLDVTERAYLHEAVANALESLYGDQSEQVAVQLAFHYEQAGLTEKAVTYLLQAGEHAQGLSAHQQAIHHLTQGLTLLALLPASTQRAQQELALQIALSKAFATVKGYAAAETGEAYNRAHKLAVQAEEATQIFAALSGLQMYHNAHIELHAARVVAEQMLQLAQNQADPVLRVLAHYALANFWYVLGEFVPAREQLELGISLYNPQDHRLYIRLCGQDGSVVCLAQLGSILGLLGYPEQALRRSYEALTLARELEHSFSLAVALNYNTGLHLHRREERIAKGQAESLIQLATEQGFGIWLAAGISYRGRAMVRLGEAEGIEQMQRGLKARLALEDEVFKSYFLAELAVGYETIGESAHGLNLLDEGLAHVDKTDNRAWEAEIYRLKGELLLKLGQGTESGPATQYGEAEAFFRQAIDVARRQQAKLLELRAVTSLCRLWQAQGKGAEAHTLLAEIYGWFSEGFDIADLVEAKALLEQLQ